MIDGQTYICTGKKGKDGLQMGRPLRRHVRRGAALFPLANALLLRVFPQEQRGLAMGFYAIPALLAPALGPTLGGYLITYAEAHGISNDD